jgi:hypothetical protein
MSAPYISMTTSAALTVTGFVETNKVISYMLYADGFAFENWTDWVNDSNNSPSNRQSSNASTYTNYVWKFYCELGAVSNACGFSHATHGAYWVISNTDGEIEAAEDTSTAVSNTAAMTAAQLTSWVDASTPEITSSVATIISNTSIADPYF